MLSQHTTSPCSKATIPWKQHVYLNPLFCCLCVEATHSVIYSPHPWLILISPFSCFPFISGPPPWISLALCFQVRVMISFLPVFKEMHTNNATPVDVVSNECPGCTFNWVWLMLWSERHLNTEQGDLLFLYTIFSQTKMFSCLVIVTQTFPTEVVVIKKNSDRVYPVRWSFHSNPHQTTQGRFIVRRDFNFEYDQQTEIDYHCCCCLWTTVNVHPLTS